MWKKCILIVHRKVSSVERCWLSSTWASRTEDGEAQSCKCARRPLSSASPRRCTCPPSERYTSIAGVSGWVWRIKKIFRNRTTVISTDYNYLDWAQGLLAVKKPRNMRANSSKKMAKQALSIWNILLVPPVVFIRWGGGVRVHPLEKKNLK